MATTDLDVIKDIPGYKAILKAVLKSQIQKLVEQLAAHTDEESVILTASVADGTLSHLGSDSGKGFLEDHEDVKSQFLGFCLKRHNKKQQEMEELKRQTLLESMQQMPVPVQLGYGPAPRRLPQTSYPRPTIPRASPSVGIRSPGVRHEPYVVLGRPRKSSANMAKGSMPTTPVKLEPSDTSNDGVSESNNVNQSPSQSALSRDDDVSDSSSSTIPNDPSELSASTISETGALHNNNDQKIKVEAISGAEMELEITGVEPGRQMLSQDWDPNVSMGMNFDPNSGATGTAGDMQQGYNAPSPIVHCRSQEENAWIERFSRRKLGTVNLRVMDEEVSRAVAGITDVSVPAVGAEVTVSEEGYVCQICGISFTRKNNFKRHMRVHEDNDDPKCQICERIFTRKDNLTAHTKTAHSQSDMTMEDNIICDECGKQCKSKRALSDHKRIHSKRHVCDTCDARFSHKNKLKRHIASHSQQKQQCQKCLRYFIQLKEHMERCKRTYDERKPAFECTSCKKSFKEKRYLNQHNKIVHNNNNNAFYECQHCRLNFRHRSSRLLHLRKEHPK